jgi:hypothetical protein
LILLKNFGVSSLQDFYGCFFSIKGLNKTLQVATSSLFWNPS